MGWQWNSSLFFMVEKVYDISEADFVFGDGGDEVFVGFDDGIAFGLARGVPFDITQCGGGGEGGLFLHGQDAVEPEIFHHLEASCIGVEDAQVPFGAEAHGDAGEGTEEGGVHEFAIFEV